MSYSKNLDMLFVIGFFSLIIFTSWAILELRSNDSSITVSLLNIASATPVSNNTIINTTLGSSNATTTIVEDSNGTITTIPELEDRRHAPLR